MKTRAKAKTHTKTKTKTYQHTVTRTMASLMIAGALLAAAAAGFASIKNNKVHLGGRLGSFPYQTVGYTPGYVPGYIPGSVPGYSVPGYIPGYGTFEALSTPDFIKKTTDWLKKIKK